MLRNIAVLGLLVLIGAGVLADFRSDDRVVGWLRPAVAGAGLTQTWAMFAPPRTSTNYFGSRTDYADGSSSTWRIPIQLGFWDFVDYRWGKIGDYSRDKAHAAGLEPLARFIADRDRAPGREPVAVTLTVDWVKLAPPGEPSDGQWHQQNLYTLRLAPPVRPGGS